MKKSFVKKIIVTTVLLAGIVFGTKVEASNQGPYIKDGSMVQVTKKNYDMWQNFGWKYKNNTNNILNQVFKAQGRYQHFNGSTYYSLYDNKGTWYGYLNASATKKINPQGAYISDGRYVQITKNYELWQNFNWKKKGNGSTYYNQGLQARGRYQHFNGNTYYSLFNDKGAWLGYINANATTQYKPKQTKSTKTVNKNTEGRILSSTKGYKYVSESIDGGQTTKRPNGDMHTTYTKTVIWEKDASNPYMGTPISNSDLEMSFNGGKGVGNSGMIWLDQMTASIWAIHEIANTSSEGGSYLTWEVKLKTGEIMWTAHIN